MSLLALLPVAICALLLAAHFYRAGLWPLVAGALAIIALLFVRRPWAARAVQLGLMLGSIEWLRALLELIMLRQAMGAPWLRLSLILGAIAALTLVSTLVFRMPALRRRYGLDAAAFRGRS